MDDTISRQWLMECVNEGWIKFDTQEDENRFVHLIRDIAPSAQRWIPCKTAFPKKENTRAIIQTNSETVIIDGVYGGIDVYGHHVWRDGEGGLYWDDEIVAWMPFVIPEPWKGGEE